MKTHQDQKGFICGSYVKENVRLVYDISFETKQHDVSGLLLSNCFQQAFGAIPWKFIRNVLGYFNFEPFI